MDLGVEGRTAVAPEVGEPVAGDRRHDALAVDASDLVEPRVSEVEVVSAVERDVEGQHLRGGGRAAVATVAVLAVPGKRRNRSRSVDLAQAIAIRVGNVYIAVSIEGDIPGVGETGR